MRSGVPVGIVRGMVAGATRSTSTARGSSAEEGGAHSETLASSRGASSQAETCCARAAPSGAASGADWHCAAETQSRNDKGRHEQIRARYMIFSSACSPGGGIPGRFQELRYSRSQHEMSMPALSRPGPAALPEPFAKFALHLLEEMPLGWV